MPKPSSGKLLEDDKSKGQFMRKLAIDFASEIRKMQPFLDKIVLTIDSKSWRKDLFPEAEYKGTRTQDDTVEWESVYQIYEEFKTGTPAQILEYLEKNKEKQRGEFTVIVS